MRLVSHIILGSQTQHKEEDHQESLRPADPKTQEWSPADTFPFKLHNCKEHYGKPGVSSIAAALGLRKQQCMNIIREYGKDVEICRI